jgi:hypothetical protein
LPDRGILFVLHFDIVTNFIKNSLSSHSGDQPDMTEYWNEAERLASFTTKRSRKLKWPHASTHSITPESLAAAGFYSKAFDGAADAAKCFMCGCTLANWADGDDALDEHLSHAKGFCAFAEVRRARRGQWVFPPSASEMEAARLGTFGDWWPHKKKRGWGATPQKVSSSVIFGLGWVVLTCNRATVQPNLFC